MQNLYKALAAAAAELKNPLADRQNTHFGQPYATLQSVVDTVRPVLAKHGLSVIMVPRVEKRDSALYLVLQTTLVHVSGESLSWETPWPVEANIQKLGAAITYLRRYVLCALCNVVGDVDDDAETVTAPSREQRR
jgi:hypothetical protein